MPGLTATRPAQHPGPLIEARGLCAGYGQVQVVHDLDLQVRPGQLVALIGPNGAGKTTTLLTLCGELPPLGGEVRWLGSAARTPLHRRAREGLGLITEERSIFPALSVRDNLRVSGGDPTLALDLFPALTSRLRVKAGLLSGGEQQMLALARVLARRPRLLLADELSLGLAPKIVSNLLAAVRAAADDGVGILLVEQHISEVLSIADDAHVLRRGQTILTGAASHLATQTSLIESSYLSEPVRN
jgi:branched-chain amino acid transport system ATP-binding protein